MTTIGAARQRWFCQHQVDRGQGRTVWSAQANAYLNAVNHNKPKMLNGLRQTGTVVGSGSRTYPDVDAQHHRRKGRTYPVLSRTPNPVSPMPSRTGRQSQDAPMGQRVEEEGQSEGWAVMAQIGVEQKQHHPARKRAHFPLVSPYERA